MCILAGVDFLGKFYAGSDAQGGVRDRFTSYLQRYFDLDDPANDAETVYQLRNALLHSFGLFSRTRHQTYRFELMAGENPLLEQYEPEHYRVNHRRLFEKWEGSIALYRAGVMGDRHLARNFFRMIPEYGSTRIGTTPQTP
jgi:hypothetical protein